MIEFEKFSTTLQGGTTLHALVIYWLGRLENGDFTMTYRVFFSLFLLVALLNGCANTKGPRVVHTYDSALGRKEIAVIRLEQKRSLKVLACDGIGVPDSARFLLVRPGRHEVVFSIFGMTLVEVYQMTNKKYIEAVGGHTYILQSETGILTIGNKWFPEVVDVTDDPMLHVTEFHLSGVH